MDTQPVPEQQTVNLIDPATQEVGSVPASMAPKYLQQGYSQATPEETDAFINDQKYGGAGQQALTGLEGAAQSATFGVSTAAERALGVPKEDIAGRRETNPITHVIGQGAGLVGSSLLIPGGGAAGALDIAGNAGVHALGLEGATGLAKIGSAAVKGAIENAAVQGGDEVSRSLYQNHPEGVQTAIANVGLAALLGGGISGGIGAVSPLWKATTGDKLGGWLESIQRRVNGEAIALPEDVQAALTHSGIEVPGEIRSVLSGEPELIKQFNILQESKTTPGLNLKESVNNFQKSAGDQMISALGKTPEEILPKSEVSLYESGKEAASALHSELKEQIGPVIERMEERKIKYGSASVSDGDIGKIAENVASLAQQQGWATSPSSDIMKEVNRVLKELKLQKNLKALGQFQTEVGNNTFDPMNGSLTRAGSLIKKEIRSVESEIMERVASPQEAALMASDRQAYGAANELRDQLNDRLHIKAGSIQSWVKGLEEMGKTDGESVIRRLSGKGDANLLSLLKEQFPKTAELIKQHNLNDLLGTAASKAPEGHNISPHWLAKGLEKMSPEMRAFALPNGAEGKIGAITKLIDSLPKYKTSNTAGNLDSLWSKVPGGAMSLAAMLTGHNPAVGFILGQTAKWVSRDAPDAIRLAMLKFLGHAGPAEPEAFKAMVDFIQSTIKGQNMIAKGTEAVLKAGREVLPQSQVPNEKDRNRLDKKLKELQKDSSPLMDAGGKTAHYLPDHGAAMGQTAANAVQYLNSLRPNTDKAMPLDAVPKVNKIASSEFNRALDIAEQPLVVLKDLKNGTLTPQDVTHLKVLYPDLYDKMNQHLMNGLITKKADDEPIPYKTKLSLSLFMGQPLDSTMTMLAIQATQPVQTQEPQPGMAQSKPKGSMDKLGKLSAMYQTPQQARTATKAT